MRISENARKFRGSAEIRHAGRNFTNPAGCRKIIKPELSKLRTLTVIIRI